MTHDAIFILTLVTALGCGLIAGIFFAFSSFVMKVLARLPPPQGMAAMQAINVAVVNGWFLVAFFGTAAGCLVLAASSLGTWQTPAALCRLIGGVLYPLGTIGVTIAFNVPRNNALAAVAADSADGAARWARYVPGWTAWNHVRTATALAAATLLTISLCQ